MDDRTPARGEDEGLRSRQVELVLQQVDALPTLSPVATRLMSIGSAEEFDLDEVAMLLESDPALSAMIIGMCRRADVGLGDRVQTVRQAVLMLGIEAVQSAVLSVQIYELINTHDDESAPADGGPAFDRVGVWKHAVAVACASEWIASEHRAMEVSPDRAFVAGMLHDLGKLVLDLVLPRAYARVLRVAEQRQTDSAPVERSLIGLDHHTAGRRLAERWMLPQALQDVMWLHSQPYASVPDLPHRPLIGVVTVAKALCRRHHLGWSGDFGEPPDTEETCRALGIDASRLGACMARVVEAVVERCRALGLDEQTTPQLLLESVSAANRRLSRLNATLQTRARLSRQQARVLEAIGRFHEGWDAEQTVVGTLGRVVASASGLLGAGYYGAVYQPSPGEAWHVYQFAPDGRLLRSQAAEPPPGDHGGSLASLGGSSPLTMAAMGTLPWLTDYVGDATDLRRVRFVTLAGATEGSAPSAVLLHDRDPAAAGLSTQQLGAVVAAWSASVLAAARHERGRRLGEQLAAANRSLAEAQARLTERESLIRLGEMSAGAAHEMNNPLTVIRGRSQLLSSGAMNSRDKAAAEAIAEAAEHLSELISSLHLIADPPRPARARTDPMLMVREAVDAARSRTGESTRVRLSAAERLGPIEIDRELVARALSEVVTNAIEAAPDQIVEVDVHTDPHDGRLVIRVRDKGSGMSARALKHAFDPFFSEKPAGRQTGLGLARARRLVELHGGEIALESRAGKGTVATVVLPARAGQGSDGRAASGAKERAAA